MEELVEELHNGINRLKLNYEERNHLYDGDKLSNITNFIHHMIDRLSSTKEDGEMFNHISSQEEIDLSISLHDGLSEKISDIFYKLKDLGGDGRNEYIYFKGFEIEGDKVIVTYRSGWECYEYDYLAFPLSYLRNPDEFKGVIDEHNKKMEEQKLKAEKLKVIEENKKKKEIKNWILSNKEEVEKILEGNSKKEL